MKRGLIILIAAAVIILNAAITCQGGAISRNARDAPSESTNLQSTDSRYEILRGRDGQPGRDGRDGLVGPQGLPGIQGPPGPTCPGTCTNDKSPGEKGPPGIQGIKGDQGEMGPPGSPGMQGNVGSRGEKGTLGIQGLKGDQGEMGARGVPGNNGNSGERGVQGLKGDRGELGPPGAASGGVTYTRWGKSSCPDVDGTQLLYAGRAGGTGHTQRGGASNRLYMPDNPDYTLSFQPGVQGYSYVHGIEYEAPLTPGRQDLNVPCAVCYISSRSTTLMIPAKTTCPTNWTREYYGYLMSEKHNHHSSMFDCIDKEQEPIPGSHANINLGSINGALYYNVEAHCSGMACPPYDAQKELNCVVCSK